MKRDPPPIEPKMDASQQLWNRANCASIKTLFSAIMDSESNHTFQAQQDHKICYNDIVIDAKYFKKGFKLNQGEINEDKIKNVYLSIICRMYIDFYFNGIQTFFTQNFPKDLFGLILMFCLNLSEMELINTNDYNFDYKYLKFRQSQIQNMDKYQLWQHSLNVSIMLNEEKILTKSLYYSEKQLIQYLRSQGRESLIKFERILFAFFSRPYHPKT